MTGGNLMFKRTLLATILTIGAATAASAAPIVGSFSLASFSGTYMNGANPSGTAATATGLDFGPTFGGAGNGYGTNGSALVGNADGSFAIYSGSTASVADISLGATANPYTTNPFVTFGSGANALLLSFSNASISRTSTSITVTGSATFTDGNPADATTGTFTLATSSQQGNASSVQFTFTGNGSANAVPEPVSISLLGAGLVGMGVVRLRRKA